VPAISDDAGWASLREAASPELFYRAWLGLQCRMLPDVLGGLVLLGAANRGPFSPVAVWPRVHGDMKALTAAAERVLQERRSLIVEPPADAVGGRPRAELALPIELDGALVGAVVLDVTPRPAPALEHALQQLVWGSAWLEAFLRRGATSEVAASGESLQRLVQLVVAALEKEHFQDAATHFATEVAAQLGCDRVSVGTLRGDRIQLEALSHSAQFGKRSNLVRAIEAAMDEALEQRRSLVFPAASAADAEVLRSHQELARDFGSGAICSVPLARQDSICGVLLLERVAERDFEPDEVALAEAASALAGPILELERREDRWIFEKLAESLRRPLEQLLGPHHIVAKLTALAVTLLVLFFAFAHGDYRISAHTLLEARELRAAVAPFDGYVSEAPVRAGDLVREGQLLARLDDRDLRIERLRWESEVRQLANQNRQAMADRDAAQVRILQAGLDRARARLGLIEQRLERTLLRAPFDGVVALGDLSQQLGAPVRRGDVLFEVAPLDAYRVVLEVDESDVREVSVGQQGQLVLAGAPHDPLPIEVKSVTPVSTASEGRNFFRVEAELGSTPERLRPGMEGVGKIDVGRRRLIWIWVHPAIDWLRLTLWRWFP
jgi:biotin carboxyl carrier protein